MQIIESHHFEEEQIIDKQIEAEKIVFETLAENEEARNDDNFLFKRIAEKKGLVLIIPKGFCFETYRRSRQKIQESGNLLPTSAEVCYKRKIKETVLRKYFGNKSMIFQKIINHYYGVK